MTLNENIDRIEAAKQSIKTAIEGKGITVPAATKLEGYPALVDKIKEGGSIYLKDFPGFKLSDSIWSTIPDFIKLDGIEDMSNFFNNNGKLVKCPYFDLTKTTNAKCAFEYCKSLEELPELDFSNVLDARYMFCDCSSLVNAGRINTSKATKLDFFFSGCSSLTSVSEIDLTSAIGIQQLFDRCISLERTPVLNTSNIENMMLCFFTCTNLKTVELTGGMKPNCYCNTCFLDTPETGKLILHTGNSITRENYQPIINQLPTGWTIEEINDLK